LLHAAGIAVRLAACDGEKAQVHEELMRSYDAFYMQAWGASPDEEQRAAFNRQIDCVWDEIARTGGDPGKDLRCAARRLDAGPGCYRSHPNDSDASVECVRTTCSVSAVFEQASKTTCRLAPQGTEDASRSPQPRRPPTRAASQA
jgi:hypothetical protein